MILDGHHGRTMIEHLNLGSRVLQMKEPVFPHFRRAEGPEPVRSHDLLRHHQLRIGHTASSTRQNALNLTPPFASALRRKRLTTSPAFFYTNEQSCLLRSGYEQANGSTI